MHNEALKNKDEQKTECGKSTRHKSQKNDNGSRNRDRESAQLHLTNRHLIEVRRAKAMPPCRMTPQPRAAQTERNQIQGVQPNCRGEIAIFTQHGCSERYQYNPKEQQQIQPNETIIIMKDMSKVAVMRNPILGNNPKT